MCALIPRAHKYAQAAL